METEKKKLPHVTEDELYEYAEKIVKWIDPNDENDPDGRYWLACYQGCGEYRLFVQNGMIMGAIYGSYFSTMPFLRGKFTPNKLWVTVVNNFVRDRIGGGGTIRKIKAYGSGTHFFLRDPKYKKYIATREYDVPDANGGMQHYIEIINVENL